jgi:hypothetical protein
MSKDRARRRDEREQAAAVRRVAAQRRRARTDRRRERRRAVVAPLSPRVRHRRHGQQGILAQRRRMQNGVILCLILASQLVVWLLTANWYLRASAVVLAVVATPVLVTLTLDRRR